MFRYRVSLMKQEVFDNVVVSIETDLGSFDTLPEASEATRVAISAIPLHERICYSVTIFDNGKPSGPFKI